MTAKSFCEDDNIWHVIFASPATVLHNCALVCSGVRNGMKSGSGSHSAILQPLLFGLTAVVGFLIIIFIVLVFHRLFRKNRSEIPNFHVCLGNEEFFTGHFLTDAPMKYNDTSV
uniref:Uncharacterized protein n=1 Tax=Echeneis naucrates TaxID=173247 RepID=A0A665SVN7_ECHNA